MKWTNGNKEKHISKMKGSKAWSQELPWVGMVLPCEVQFQTSCTSGILLEKLPIFCQIKNLLKSCTY